MATFHVRYLTTPGTAILQTIEADKMSVDTQQDLVAIFSNETPTRVGGHKKEVVAIVALQHGMMVVKKSA